MSAEVSLDISQRLDITCRKGDTFILSMNVTDSAGDVEDLSSRTWKMEVKDTDTTLESVITDDLISITGTSLGVLTITIPSSVMDDITGDTIYVYDLQTTLASVTRTWFHGLFTVNEDVTE